VQNGSIKLSELIRKHRILIIGAQSFNTCLCFNEQMCLIQSNTYINLLGLYTFIVKLPEDGTPVPKRVGV